VKAGTLSPCEFINVESEFARCQCRSARPRPVLGLHRHASQGLLFMMEAVYNAAGLGLPIVIPSRPGDRRSDQHWNDHSDPWRA